MAALTHLDFEAPVVAASTAVESYLGSLLTDTAWVFGSGTGIAANGSSMVTGNAAAPDGTQVAFIKGESGRLEQDFTVASTTTYTITFKVAWSVQSSKIHFPMFLDMRIRNSTTGTMVGIWTTYVTSTSYTTITVSGIALATGNTYNLSFVPDGPGLGPRTNIVFIDTVTIA
jgi:hypothetical protein